MSSASATTPTPATGGFTEASLRGVPEGPRRAAWLLDRRRAGVRGVLRRCPCRPRATRNGGGPTSAALKLGQLRPAGPARALGRGPLGPGPGLGGPERPLRDRARARQRRRRPGRPTRAKLGGAILVDLATAAKEHPEILERYLLTDAVSPTRRRLLGPPRGVLDRRDAALRARRASRSRPRCSPWSGWPTAGGSTSTTRSSSSKKGPRRRSSARPPASAGATPRPCMPGRSSCSSAGGRSSGSSTSRTGTPRPGTSAASGPWSAPTPRSSGPSAASARGWRRSTRRSR